MTFRDLGLEENLLKAINEAGYKTPSKIQEQAIPYILEGKDLLGCAQTGTGKTAAFALPIINNLVLSGNTDGYNKHIKVLVLTPTRELAIQVRDNFKKYSVYTNLKYGVLLGGVNQHSQVQVLRKGVDILVATPGRLLDLIDQKHVKLDMLRTLVLDEADTMLDMGFIHDVKKIMKYIPIDRQTLLFSATMPKEVMHLAKELLKDYVTVKVNSESITVKKIEQSVYFIDRINKPKLLLDLLKCNDLKSTLIFTRTKHGANKLSEILERNGINTSVIHGDKTQGARLSALNYFKSGRNRVLVATDIAARGIDIIELSHVINYDIPEKVELYIHRIGRTGRAGLGGKAISFCSIDEKRNLKEIEKLINETIMIVDNHNYPVQQSTSSPENVKNSKDRRASYRDKKKNNHQQASGFKKRKFDGAKKDKWYKKSNKYLTGVK